MCYRAGLYLVLNTTDAPSDCVPGHSILGEEEHPQMTLALGQQEGAFSVSEVAL